MLFPQIVSLLFPLVLSTPLLRFETREVLVTPLPNADETEKPMVENVPKLPLGVQEITPKDDSQSRKEDDNFQMDVVDRKNTKEMLDPECQSCEENEEKTAEKTEKNEELAGEDTQETVPIIESVVEIGKLKADPTLPAKEEGSFPQKQIDVTLTELEQPVAVVNLPNEIIADEETEEEVPAVAGLDEQKEFVELDVNIIGQLDDKDCEKTTITLRKPVIEHHKTLSQENEEIREQFEHIFRVVVYFLSLLADAVEDEPSTWQKIIAGVQCVLRDCREALPFRPSDRSPIREAGYIIRRARDSLCPCYIGINYNVNDSSTRSMSD